MSPEQLLGLEIDARSDLYSLGVTFYEILTGRLPFQRSATGSDWEIRKGHIELDPPSIQEFRPEVHSQLAAIIARSLKKSPNERYQSAAEFLEAVRNYEQHHAEKEQALHSPTVKNSQPRASKPTQQAMKSTLVDETATLIARPAPARSPAPSPAQSPDGSSEESAPSRKAHLEDEITRLMKPGDSSPASATATALSDFLGAKSAAATPSALAAPAAQSGRRWPLAISGLGLLLVGTAAGAILFSQRNAPERAPQTETAKVETQSPTPALSASPAARATPKLKASPTPGEKTAFKQAQKFEQQEQYDEAIKVYEDYLARNANAPDANVVASYLDGLRKLQATFTAADSAMNSRMYPQAKRAYIKALELRPNSQRAKLGLADADIKMRTTPPPGGNRVFQFEFHPPARDKAGQGRKVSKGQTGKLNRRIVPRSINPRLKDPGEGAPNLLPRLRSKSPNDVVAP